jgi:hypothetical protein
MKTHPPSVARPPARSLDEAGNEPDDAELSGDEQPLSQGDPMVKAMAALTSESRSRGAPPVDFDELERALFARIDAGDGPSLPLVVEPPAPSVSVVRLVPGRGSDAKPARRGVWPLAAAFAAVAAAAAGLLINGRIHQEAPPPPLADLAPPTAAPAPLARRVKTGDAPQRFEHAGLASWVLEPNTQARVTEQRDVILVELDEGAVQVDVVPQPVAERFVVLAGKTRVAVRGTLFRVARIGEQVEVDVEHGTVSVGEAGEHGEAVVASPEREAPITLVRGPSGGTFRLDGHPGQVRPVKLFSGQPAGEQGANTHAEADPPSPPPPSENKPAGSARASGSTPSPTHGEPARPAQGVDQSALKARATAAAATCFEQNARLPAGVNVTVTTTLSLELGANGKITSYTFSPTLAPAVVSCFAARVAGFKGAAGKLEVPLELVGRR